MQVQEIIDIALSQGDNVPESDAGYIDRRRRHLNWLRETVYDVWWERDWPFKNASTDVTVPALVGYTAVPDRFNSIGVYGGVYLLVGGLQQHPPLELVPEVTLRQYRNGSYVTSNPRVFALFGQEPTTFVDLIQIPTNAAAVTLRCAYQKKPPLLLDYGDPNQPSYSISIAINGSTASATTTQRHRFHTFDRVVITGATEPAYNGTFSIIVTGPTTFTFQVVGLPPVEVGTPTVTYELIGPNNALNEVPQEYHISVLLNGLKAKARESKGDARWKSLAGDYLNGKIAMKKEMARFQGTLVQLPSFFGDR